MKIMITGANGTIGADLVNFFYKKHKIFAFYRTPNYATKNFKNKNIKWIKQDLSKKIIKKINPSIIIHCVVTHPFAKKNSDKDYISSNIISLKNVLEFAKKKRVNKFFYLSSFKIYGSVNRKNVNEDDIFLKPDILGATKILSEKLIEHQKLNYLIIRLPGVVSYNISDQRRPWINSVINQLKLNNNVEIFNQYKKFNNVIDTFEIFKFIDFLKDKKIKIRKLNLSASKPIQIKKMVLDLKKNISSKSKIIFQKKKTQHFTIQMKNLKKYNFKTSPTHIILRRYIKNLNNYCFSDDK